MSGSHNIIIAEKPGVAKKIACSVCRESTCEKANCKNYFIDIFIHHHNNIDKTDHKIQQLRCRIDSILPNLKPAYLKHGEILPKKTSLVFSNKSNRTPYRIVNQSLNRIFKNWNQEDGKKPIKEIVDWYKIKKGFLNQDWIILQTNGNPQELRYNKKLNYKAGQFLPEIDQFEQGVYYAPSHKGNKSSRCLTLLFSFHLEKLRKNIDRLFVATDMDVAGTYIPTTLPGFNELSRNRIFRINLQKTSTKDIRDSIRHASPFDWNNAETGKTRAYIDYLINYGFRNIAREINSELKTRSDYSLGRNQFLSLYLIYDRWMQSTKFKEYSDSYVVLPGLGDLEAIQEAMRNGTYIAIQLNTKRGPFSPAGFLRSLADSEIGTISTRSTILDKLLKKDYVEMHGNWIIPSVKGIAIIEYLSTVMESTAFSISGWNSTIAQLVNSFGESTDEAEFRFNCLGSVARFIREFNAQLSSGKDQIKDFLIKMLELNNLSDPIQPVNKNKIKSDEEDPDERILPLLKIEKYIDHENNLLLDEKDIPISRETKIPEFNWEERLRQVLNLELEVEISVNKGIHFEQLQYVQENMVSVYRCRLPVNTKTDLFEKLESGNFTLSEFLKLNIEEPQPEKAIQQAHEPLGLFDINPEDIPGPDGFKLASEYMRPYRYTLDLYKAKEKELEIINEFIINELKFTRIAPFEFGFVHTYDTVMAAMYDRYKIAFKDTARLAEELYLA